MGKQKTLKEKKLKETSKENLSVAPGGSKDSGNTKTESSTVRFNSMKYWFFTLNNYAENELAPIKIAFEAFGEKYHIGFEVGESGTPHLQGCIQLKAKARLNEIIDNKRIHWEKIKGTMEQALDYCAKEGKPYISKGRPIPIVDKYLTCTPTWWQIEIMELLKTPPDDRKIHVYIDEIGGSGKSIFTKHLYLTEKGVVKVTGKGNDVKHIIAELISNNKEVNVVIWDLPRDCANYISYGALEEIKDGYIVSGKYESKSLAFNTPHVIIFSNELPAQEKLSQDKWIIKYINKAEKNDLIVNDDVDL